MMNNVDLASGQPVPMANEMFVLARSGINFSAKLGGSKSEANGTLFLSTLRMVFVTDRPTDNGLNNFDIPLATLEQESFNQPIFFANNMTGCSPPLDGSDGVYKWCISFKNGGVGTFLPFFFRLLQEMRTRMQALSANPQGVRVPLSDTRAAPAPAAHRGHLIQAVRGRVVMCPILSPYAKCATCSKIHPQTHSLSTHLGRSVSCANRLLPARSDPPCRPRPPRASCRLPSSTRATRRPSTCRQALHDRGPRPCAFAVAVEVQVGVAPSRARGGAVPPSVVRVRPAAGVVLVPWVRPLPSTHLRYCPTRQPPLWVERVVM